MPDDSMSDSLGGFFKKEFEKYKAEELSKSRQLFNEEKQGLRGREITGIEKQKHHDHLLNMCIFPFIQQGKITKKLNYHFVRAEPLQELGIPNLDFLIYNAKSKVAIFGEVKASFNSNSNSAIVKETRERVNILHENMDYIIENYLGEVPKHCEYVLAIYSINDDILEDVWNSGGNLIVWSADHFHDVISCKSFRSEEDGMKRGVLHKDVHLRRALKKAQTSGNQYNLFPSSHFIVFLKRIVAAREEREDGWYLTRAALMEKLHDELHYLGSDSDLIKKMCDRIIKGGIELNILAPPEQDSSYRLIPQIATQNSLEKKIKEAYIKSRLEEESKRRDEEAIQRATERLMRLKKQRPDLEQFS